MPILTASTPMSSATARTCSTTNSPGTGWIPVTPTVLCAVSAVIAVIPCTPQRANAFRSAWMPAPPPESDPAIESTAGTRGEAMPARLASDAVDHAIQRYIRTAASRGRELEHVGPFVATFDRHSDHPYLSYAMPDDGAEPSAADVAALRAAFARRGRIPRLEYIPAVAPAAEAALLAGGFAVEARLPLMTCAPGEAPDVAPPEGVELILPTSDDELRSGGAVAKAAFGEP